MVIKRVLYTAMAVICAVIAIKGFTLCGIPGLDGQGISGLFVSSLLLAFTAVVNLAAFALSFGKGESAVWDIIPILAVVADVPAAMYCLFLLYALVLSLFGEGIIPPQR